MASLSWPVAFVFGLLCASIAASVSNIAKSRFDLCSRYRHGFCVDTRKYACQEGDVTIRSNTGCSRNEVCCLPKSHRKKHTPSDCGVPVYNKHFRIVGGSATSITSFPWQVAIYVKSKFQCGGTLITRSWVLTAAHCVDTVPNAKAEDFRVLVGTTNLSSYHHANLRTVTMAAAHKWHKAVKISHDIALLRLSHPVNTGSPFTKPICLDFDSTPTYSRCVATGWGFRHEGINKTESVLRVVEMTVYNKSDCEAKTGKALPSKTVCSGGAGDTCSGDSGGPLACLTTRGVWVQVGITSTGRGCGRRGMLGLYTDVTQFGPWVRSVLSLNASSPWINGLSRTFKSTNSVRN